MEGKRKMINPLKILLKIPSQLKLNIVVIVLIVFLIWFVFPHVLKGAGYLFSGIRLRLLIITIALIAYELGLFLLLIQQYKAKTIPMLINKLKLYFNITKSGGINAWQYSKENFNNLSDKIKKDQKRRRLRCLPWYLVLGAPGSGKKSLLKNLGIYFSRPEQFGEEAINYINQFPDYEWWFSEQAVFIDAMTYEKEVGAVVWKKLIKLLRRERKNKPFNGVVITFNLADLILYSNKSRQDFLQDICGYIRDLHHYFKSKVPVYLIFNKCDLVEGFMEFFNDLSKEELRQVWGMTFPFEKCNDPNTVQLFFEKEYGAMIIQLRKRVMWALDTERSIRGRELINAFPQQMLLLKKPIESFIVELFGSTRYHNALQCRGIYFTSCDQQEGTASDFVLQAMSKKFQLVPPKFERPVRLGESYFLRSLFFEIMLPEAHILGDSERSKRIARLSYRSLLLSCPTIVILASTGMMIGYKENTVNLKDVDREIHFYHETVSTMDQRDISLLSSLSVLDSLNKANLLYQSSSDFGLRFLFVSHFIGNAINNALQRTLHSAFLPRIAAQLEDDLNQNIEDQNLLYATLKGYLAFSSTSDTPSFSINAPMDYAWNISLKTEPETIKKLKYYLKLSLKKNVEKLPLDNSLIDRIRGRLEQVIPSQRAYGLLSLRSSVNDYPDTCINLSVGSEFSRAFVLSNQKASIPSLYTVTGFNKIFLGQYQAISKEVAEDNRDIGLANESNTSQDAEQIKDLMQKNYETNYIHYWDNSFANIQLRQFNSLADAISTLTLLISKQSPLSKMLNVVYDNTATISHNKVQVARYYATLNSYSNHATSGSSWFNTVKILSRLRDYLITLQQSVNQNEACFNAAVALMHGTSNNPIQQLSEEAKNAPEPVKRWVTALSNNSWQIIVQGAHAQMNDAWKNSVMDEYNKSIRNRFPLNRSSTSDIAISDFNSFFRSGGSLQNYFNKFIKPFVNIDRPDWSLYSLNGHTIELPRSTIKIFEKAKAIKDDYFDHDAKQASFNFTIEPLSLDSNARCIQMTIGLNQIIYSHGPRSLESISWPMPFNSENASLYITTFSDHQYGNRFSGPWSIFKMFNHGLLNATRDDGAFLFNINWHGHYASYRITGKSDIRTFKMTNLNGFRLPPIIAPNIAPDNFSGIERNLSQQANLLKEERS